MARRRLEKKARKQRSAVEETLARLYERGADRELLAVARRRLGEPTRSAVAGLYLEVADRALARTLAAADLDLVDGLLAELSPAARQRPLALLAAAVAALRRGEETAACTVLERLAAGQADLPAGVAEASRRLLVVARQPPRPRRGHPPRCPVREAHPSVDALVRLRQVLARLSWAPPTPLPPAAAGPGDGLAQALWLAARGVAAIARGGYRPTRRQLGDLAAAALALRRATPSARAVGEVVEQRRADLDALGELLSGLRSGRGVEVRQALAMIGDGRIPRQAGSPSGAADEDPLTAHLSYTLQLRWREVLGHLLASDQVSHEQLDLLRAAQPDRLGALLAGGGAPAEAPRGIGRAEALELVASEQYSELAAAIAALAARESDAGRLAALWGVELEATWRSDDGCSLDDDEIDDIDPETWSDAADRRLGGALGRLVARLAEMARDLVAHVPEEQRPAIARLLRDQLLVAARQVELRRPVMQRAVRRLVAALPEDPIVLTLHYAACEAAEIAGEARRAADRLRALPTSYTGAQEALDLLVAALAEEHHVTLARTLERARPLFPPAAWERALQAAEGAAVWVSLDLMASPLADDDPDLARRDALARLDALEPFWGGSAELAAVRLVVAAYGAPDAAGVRGFLERFARLDAALFLATALIPFVDYDPGYRQPSLAALAAFIVDHLELPTDGWAPHANALIALCVLAGEGRRLAGRLRQLADQCPPVGSERLVLARLALMLDQMRFEAGEISRPTSSPWRAAGPPPRRRRAARRPPAEPSPAEQLDLDLWGDDEP